VAHLIRELVRKSGALQTRISTAQAADLVYLTGGATSLYATCPIERAFRDIHAATQHISVHPRMLETTGRVLFGLDVEAPTLLLL
jgi:hypothetical protein